MKIEGCVALVTGANRGIGLGFVKVLLERGAEKVYATARDARQFARCHCTGFRSAFTGLALDMSTTTPSDKQLRNRPAIPAC